VQREGRDLRTIAVCAYVSRSTKKFLKPPHNPNIKGIGGKRIKGPKSTCRPFEGKETQVGPPSVVILICKKRFLKVKSKAPSDWNEATHVHKRERLVRDPASFFQAKPGKVPAHTCAHGAKK